VISVGDHHQTGSAYRGDRFKDGIVIGRRIHNQHTVIGANRKTIKVEAFFC
jgi:hypothetical protein